MKICIIQLARIGDIYQAAPAISAYKRVHPEHEITLLVRNKFSEACHGLADIDHVIELPSKHILSPFIADQPDISEGLSRLESWLLELSDHNFDKIFNLSFSPLSSYITFFLENAATTKPEVKGYTRTQDGFLAIPDDMSAYFYAQVGNQKPNRFHMNEIFGTVLGVDLLPEDWKTQDLNLYPLPFDGPFIAIQPSASTPDKSIPAQKISLLLNQLKQSVQVPIVLLGSSQDITVGNQITSSTSYPQLYNFIGKTQLIETMAIVKQATLLIAPDSSLQNMASLTNTRTLNVSTGDVNFWETGPRAAGSFVLTSATADDINISALTEATKALLYGETSLSPGYNVTNEIPCYKSTSEAEDSFSWQLLQFIYQGAPLPKEFSAQFILALEKLEDVNNFALEILTQIEEGSEIHDRAPFLQRAEEIIQAIYEISSDIRPIISWYRTEKVRIGPGSNAEVLAQTRHVHELVHKLCQFINEHVKNIGVTDGLQDGVL